VCIRTDCVEVLYIYTTTTTSLFGTWRRRYASNRRQENAHTIDTRTYGQCNNGTAAAGRVRFPYDVMLLFVYNIDDWERGGADGRGAVVCRRGTYCPATPIGLERQMCRTTTTTTTTIIYCRSGDPRASVVRVADDVCGRRSDCSRLPHTDTSTTSTASVAKYHIRYHYYHCIPRTQRARVLCPTLNSTLVVCSVCTALAVDRHNLQFADSSAVALRFFVLFR